MEEIQSITKLVVDYGLLTIISAIFIWDWVANKKQNTETLKELKDPAVQAKFSTIIIDTADIAYDLCEKYICQNAKRSDGGFGVDSIGDIGFGKGYTMVAKEFDESLRAIVQMNYGLVIISHAVDKSFTDQEGKEFYSYITIS